MNKFENHHSHPSIDIIPLQSPSGEKRKFQNMQEAQKFRGQEGPNRNFHEQILSRVQSYLYENEDKVYINVNEMADYIQRKFREYRTKKRGQFRAMVKRAYDEITESVNRKTTSTWREDDEEEVDIESDPEEDLVSSDILKMYKKPGEKRNGNSSDKELIDICSDDDSKIEEMPVKRSRTDSITLCNKSPKKTNQFDHMETEIETNLPQERQNPEKTVQEKTVRKRQKEKEVEKYFDYTPKKQEFSAVVPKTKFSSVGGNTNALINICKSLLHVKNPQLCSHFGKSPPRGILLCGPPGCGKSLVAEAIAGELEMPLLKVAAPELVGGMSGESESRIRDLFEQALALAPCVLFLDEIDAIAPPKSISQKNMDKRIVSQLLLCLDGLEAKENGSKVLILGATSRPETLEPALRAPGRFDQEISLGIPDKEARASILKVHTANMKLSKDIDLMKLASLTPGYVGADLVALITQATMAAINRACKAIRDNPQDKEEHKEEKPSSNVEKGNETKPEEKPVDVEVSNNSIQEVEVNEPEMVDKPSEADEQKKIEEKIENKSENTPAETTETAENNTSEEAKLQDANDDAVIIDEVTVEEAATINKDSIEEPIVEEPDDSPPVKTVTECPVEIQELTEMISWLHGDVQVTAEQLEKLSIEQVDFDNALNMVQPSAKREGFATVPDVTWEDVGSLHKIRDELYLSIIAPVKHYEHFKSLGLTTSSGVLLCGPPGCGKTLLAKAIANEAEINFISIKGPELLNMYVGESEKAVRQCFIRARTSAPCVIFFDEIDALCPKRSDGDSSATSRVVNQMLTEMDGISTRQGVYLMAASNRPDILDPAVLRPGRFDKILYVGIPNAADRLEILKALTKNGTKPKLAEDVKLEEISNDVRCEGFTGADLAALIKEAGVQALRELLNEPKKEAEVCARHVNTALNKVKPSVHEKDMEHYLVLKQLYSVETCVNQDVPMDMPENIPSNEPSGENTMEAMET